MINFITYKDNLLSIVLVLFPYMRGQRKFFTSFQINSLLAERQRCCLFWTGFFFVFYFYLLSITPFLCWYNQGSSLNSKCNAQTSTICTALCRHRARWYTFWSFLGLVDKQTCDEQHTLLHCLNGTTMHAVHSARYLCSLEMAMQKCPIINYPTCSVYLTAVCSKQKNKKSVFY